MMNVNRHTIQRVAVILTVICLIPILFWTLPLVVYRNTWGSAQRFNWLPGVSDQGGLISGVSMLIYIVLAVSVIVGAVLALGTSIPATDVQDSLLGDDQSADGTMPGNETATPERDDGQYNSETPTPETSPTPSESSTPSSTPEQTPTPTTTDTPTNGVNRPTAVSVLVYVENESNHIQSGELTIYDENGTAVADHDLDERPASTFEDLEPGHNYTAEVTEVGIGNVWPKHRVTFDPDEVDQLDIDVHFEFKGADSYRYELRHYRPNKSLETNARWYAWGKVAEGDAYALSSTYSNLEFPRFGYTEYLALNGQLYIGSTDSQWRDSEYFEYNPFRMPEHMLVRESLSVVNNRTQRTFVGTRILNDSTVYGNLTEKFYDEYDGWDKTNHTTLPQELNGTKAYVFEVTFEGYSEWSETEYNYTNARVYVDPETGKVLRWQSEEILSGGGMKYDHHVVIDIYDHGEPNVDPGDYVLPERTIILN